jgi:hypothetical protein
MECEVLTDSGESVECEVLTDSGQSVQCEVLRESGQCVQCEVLTRSGQSVQYEVLTGIGQSVTCEVFTAPNKDCMTLTLMVGLAWSNESRSYAGGSVATGRVSHARLVCDEDPD